MFATNRKRISRHGNALESFCSWWRHQMETFSTLLAICAGNSPVPGEFPSQRPVTRSCDDFFDLRLDQRLSKQSWGWWFETLSCPLWRHCYAEEPVCHQGLSLTKGQVSSLLWGPTSYWTNNSVVDNLVHLKTVPLLYLIQVIWNHKTTPSVIILSSSIEINCYFLPLGLICADPGRLVQGV